MEFVYIPALEENSSMLVTGAEEYRHMRALRVNPGGEVIAVNGRGLAAVCVIAGPAEDGYEVRPIEFIKGLGELPFKLGLAIGILEKRARMEFALEKAVEFGATHFYPLITEFTQKKGAQLRRLEAKAVSAMKQCKRSALIKISQPVSLKEFAAAKSPFKDYVLLDENGIKPETGGSNSSALLLAGPEGGFSPKEIEFIKKEFKPAVWNLGERRLRAETAAALGIGLYSLNT